MLDNTWMGYLALWILWGNTLLVLAVALRRAFELLAAARRYRAAVRATIALPAGQAFASFEIEQIGRAASGERSVLLHDRAYESLVAGGSLRLEDGSELRVAEDTQLQVWAAADEVDRAVLAAEVAQFEEAFEPSTKFRGYVHQLRVPLSGGQRVFIVLEGKDKLIASMNPTRWCSRRAWFVLLVFVPALLLGAGLATALALTEPMFDSWQSKLGGLLGLFYFLLVLPAGTSLRDFLRYPHERIVRGKWSAQTETGPPKKSKNRAIQSAISSA